jgi:hypothetical protein
MVHFSFHFVYILSLHSVLLHLVVCIRVSYTIYSFFVSTRYVCNRLCVNASCILVLFCKTEMSLLTLICGDRSYFITMECRYCYRLLITALDHRHSSTVICISSPLFSFCIFIFGGIFLLFSFSVTFFFSIYKM